MPECCGTHSLNLATWCIYWPLGFHSDVNIKARQWPFWVRTLGRRQPRQEPSGAQGYVRSIHCVPSVGKAHNVYKEEQVFARPGL